MTSRERVLSAINNREFIILFIAIFIFLLSCSTEVGKIDSMDNQLVEKQIPEWFSDGKFGLFIHWGPYSVLGGEWNGNRIQQGDIAEWIMQRFEIPVKDYREVAASFNPQMFDAEEWVALAKSTGMKYIIITTKHQFTRLLELINSSK